LRFTAGWSIIKAEVEQMPTRRRNSTPEYERLTRSLAQVMQEDFIPAWLQAPNEMFGGLTPLEVVDRGEIDRLWRMIYQLESGTPG
jgi:hypothetical protein